MGKSRGTRISPSWVLKRETASQEHGFATPRHAITAFRDRSKEKRTV